MVEHLKSESPEQMERFTGVVQVSIWVRVFPGGRGKKAEEILEVDLMLENGDEMQGLAVKDIWFGRVSPRVENLWLNGVGGIFLNFSETPLQCMLHKEKQKLEFD